MAKNVFNDARVKDFTCPLSGRIMQHPTFCNDGYTYELDAITQYLKDSVIKGIPEPISPANPKKKITTILQHNDGMEESIKVFLSANPEYKDSQILPHVLQKISTSLDEKQFFQELFKIEQEKLDDLLSNQEIKQRYQTLSSKYPVSNEIDLKSRIQIVRKMYKLSMEKIPNGAKDCANQIADLTIQAEINAMRDAKDKIDYFTLISTKIQLGFYKAAPTSGTPTPSTVEKKRKTSTADVLPKRPRFEKEESDYEFIEKPNASEFDSAHSQPGFKK